MSSEKLFPLLKSLKLNGLLSHLTETPEAVDLKASEFELLKRLFNIELAYREGRSFEYRLKIAKLPQIKTIEEFDFKNVPLKAEQFHKLSECDFMCVSGEAA